MIQILLIALLSLLAQWVLPWWSLAIVAFGVCFWRSAGAGRAFLYGFVGTALVWLAYALFIHLQTNGIFTGRMGLLLFKTDNPAVPLLVAPLISGIIGGLAGLSGHLVSALRVNQLRNRTA